jgi:antitoxin ParD1/3/4
MDVSLTPEQAEFVRKLVERGDYLSPDDVIQDALVLLEDREALRALKLEALRKEIAIGIEQADLRHTRPLDLDEIRAEVAARIEQRRGRR